MIVASDRLSAFDVVLPDPIPGKGAVLTAVANFWFARLGGIVANHLTGIDPASVLDDPADRATVRDRAVVVRRARPLPVEAVVRGYLIGSGWKDYRATGQVCGIRLPADMQIADRLAEPIFTPSTKAAQGEHDENIPMGAVKSLLGDELAERIEALSLQLYTHASDYARQRGIILADTKFEFGAGRGRRVAAHRRSLHPRFVTLLARRHLRARTLAGKLRQAVRPRLPGNAGLGQETAGSAPAQTRHPANTGEVPGSPATADGRHLNCFSLRCLLDRRISLLLIWLSI